MTTIYCLSFNIFIKFVWYLELICRSNIKQILIVPHLSELIFLVFDGSQRVKYVNVDKAEEGGSYGLQKKHVKSVRDQTNKSRSTTDTYNSILWGHCHHTYRG